MDWVSDETMLFRPAAEENAAEKTIRRACEAMEEKGYNPINQLVGYLLSGDPAYITSHNDARSMIRKIERDELLEEFVRAYLANMKKEAAK